jgi:hypothetical protein
MVRDMSNHLWKPRFVEAGHGRTSRSLRECRVLEHIYMTLLRGYLGSSTMDGLASFVDFLSNSLLQAIDTIVLAFL